MSLGSLPPEEDLRRFGLDIIAWSEENPRSMPWNNLSDPYKIWIAEVILQQTRVAQGILYYKNFLEKFPDVYTLAKASEEEVMVAWEGLGYYNRARHLHEAANYVVHELGGKIPEHSHELRRLKGVGPYTAAAIASFAFGEKIGVVDGNVKRVVARRFGIDACVDVPAVHRHIQSLVDEVVSTVPSGDFNQGIMNFGALQCLPANPDCERCVFQNQCIAYQEDKVGELPVRKKSVRKKERSIHFGFYVSRGRIALFRNSTNDIWKGLYMFPLISNEEMEMSKNSPTLLEVFPWVLTHLNLKIYIYELFEYPESWRENEDIMMVKSKKLGNFALPRPLRLFLNRNSCKLEAK